MSTRFLHNETFPGSMVPVSYKFYRQSYYSGITHLRTHFLKMSLNQFLIQQALSYVTGASFLYILQTILPKRDPEFQKPLFKNESKPVSYTIKTFPVLVVPVSYKFYRQSSYSEFLQLRNHFSKTSLNQFPIK